MASIPDVRSLLKAGAMDVAADVAARHGPDLGPDDYSFELPVDEPGKIVCVGVNFPERHDEYGEGLQGALEKPSLFLRTTGSFTAHGQPLLLPPDFLSNSTMKARSLSSSAPKAGAFRCRLRRRILPV